MFSLRSFARRCRLTLEQLEDRCVPATYTVNSLTDTATPPAGTITLRSAILQAETDTAADSINFASLLAGGTITLSSALPTITRPLTITGFSDRRLTISGNDHVRVFMVAANATVTFSGLTVTTGATFDTPAAGAGAGIANNGQLTLDNLTVTGCHTYGNHTTRGGGVYSGPNSALTIRNSTISGNFSGMGAGVYTDSSSTASITGSTITGNRGFARRDDTFPIPPEPPGAYGAGIYNGGAMTLNSVVVTDNAFPATTIFGERASNYGGGIYADVNSTLTINNSTIANNLSWNGAGIAAVSSSTVTMTGTTISGNTAFTPQGGHGGSGAGILSGGSMILDRVVVTGNTVPGNPSVGGFGGGIRVGGALGGINLTVTNSTIANNSAPSGAGISIEDTATTTIFGTTIAGNSGSQGAGISNEGTLNLLSSTVSGNVSGGDGGGISIASPFTTRVSTSTIINNISAGRGGGIFNAGLQTDVYGSTITGNAAANNAGGIAIVAGSTLTLNNTIVAENTVTGVGSPNINGRVSQGSGNFIGVGDNNLTGITNGTNGNRIGNPLFPPLDPLLGPLQDNGGPTLTRAPLPGSPVINAGVTSIPSPTDLDQRGLLRIVGSAIDIGAVEFQPPGTSTTITVTPSAPVFGQSVTLSATVRPNSPPPNNTLTGTVTFFNGSTVLGAASVGTGGVASTTVPTPPPGASLYAVYSGDRNYQSSSSDATNPVVQLAPTSTVLTSVPLAVFGQTFTLSAAVSATPAVAGIVPTGTITFLNSGVPLGSVSVGSGGVATLTVAAPLAGTLSIQAAYSGDGNFQGSTSVAVASVVVRALTSTSLLSASPSPVVTGANLTLTAAVSATPALGDAAPTGTVTFLSGGVPLGSVPVDSSGVATLTVAAPLPGTLSVQASYSGDFNFGASTSSAIAVLVLDRPVSPPPPQIPRSQGQTSTSLTAPATVVLGGTFTLMATVAPSVPGAALTGTVNFSNDGTPLGTAAVGADGVATLTVAASFPGTLSLQAIYSGDADFQGSSSPPVAVRVSARSSVGAYDPATGIWSLRKSNSAGAPDGGQFAYGGPGTIGVSGDWDGDGITSIGIVEVDAATNTLVWKLRNTNSPGAPDIVVSYGGAGAIPVLGDWDGNGTVTIGVVEVDATTNTLVWKLRNSNSNGGPDIVLSYGGPGATPVVGDWDGDGTTTIGVTEIDPTANVLVWKLRNDNSPGGPNVPVFAYGGPGSVPVAADWDGDGKTTVGVFDTASAQWQLRNSNAPGAPDIAAFAFGVGTWSPVVGNWALPPVTPLPAAGAAHPVAAALEELGPAGIDSILVNQLAEAWAQLGSLPRGTLGQSLQADPLLLPGLP